MFCTANSGLCVYHRPPDASKNLFDMQGRGAQVQSMSHHRSSHDSDRLELVLAALSDLLKTEKMWAMGQLHFAKLEMRIDRERRHKGILE